MRARELGVHIGSGESGPNNAITDVAGVLVGHTTLIEGEAVRTGVTVTLQAETMTGKGGITVRRLEPDLLADVMRAAGRLA